MCLVLNQRMSVLPKLSTEMDSLLNSRLKRPRHWVGGSLQTTNMQMTNVLIECDCHARGNYAAHRNRHPSPCPKNPPQFIHHHHQLRRWHAILNISFALVPICGCCVTSARLLWMMLMRYDAHHLATHLLSPCWMIRNRPMKNYGDSHSNRHTIKSRGRKQQSRDVFYIPQYLSQRKVLLHRRVFSIFTEVKLSSGTLIMCLLIK